MFRYKSIYKKVDVLQILMVKSELNSDACDIVFPMFYMVLHIKLAIRRNLKFEIPAPCVQRECE